MSNIKEHWQEQIVEYWKEKANDLEFENSNLKESIQYLAELMVSDDVKLARETAEYVLFQMNNKESKK